MNKKTVEEEPVSHALGYALLSRWLHESGVYVFGPQTGIELVKICEEIGEAIESRPPQDSITRAYVKTYFHALNTIIEISMRQQGYLIDALGAYVREEDSKP